jgi:tol-pal system protein YbgF
LSASTFTSRVSVILCTCAALFLFDQPVWAAVPVEESINANQAGLRESQSPQSSQQATVEEGATESSLSGLFYQLQLLQQEVQELRGQLEEQQYLLQRLQKGQQDQYLDLDKRLAALAAGQSQPAPQTAQTQTAAAGTGPTAIGGGTERDAYARSIEYMRARKFDESIEGFQQLIIDYPNGQFTPNAFYWLGELFLAQKQREQARQNFMQVINLYPDHQKIPDALYKLGVVYQGLQDDTKALEYLQRVQDQHPQSPAAALAKKYAEVMVKGVE